MNKIQVKIMRGGHPLPEYETPQSAGCDLRNEDKEITLLPGERRRINTKVRIQLPDGYEAQVRGRSGLNAKHGLVVPVGTIDADYRGEIGVVIYNLGSEAFTIPVGMRIAQLIIARVSQAEWVEADSLDETERGEGGFGHTGTN